MPYGYGGSMNPYVMIIVILIVLQWFRVGRDRDDFPGIAGAPIGERPERGLLNNGGLFIIAIFLLVFCSCGRNYPIMPAVSPARYSGC